MLCLLLVVTAGTAQRANYIRLNVCKAITDAWCTHTRSVDFTVVKAIYRVQDIASHPSSDVNHTVTTCMPLIQPS
jgi:hypothetical protein